jgi:hypothetical protein
MASKASISRISPATKEKIRELYVKYGVPKYALAQRFHIYPADVTRILHRSREMYQFCSRDLTHLMTYNGRRFPYALQLKQKKIDILADFS